MDKWQNGRKSIDNWKIINLNRCLQVMVESVDGWTNGRKSLSRWWTATCWTITWIDVRMKRWIMNGWIIRRWMSGCSNYGFKDDKMDRLIDRGGTHSEGERMDYCAIMRRMSRRRKMHRRIDLSPMVGRLLKLSLDYAWLNCRVTWQWMNDRRKDDGMGSLIVYWLDRWVNEQMAERRAGLMNWWMNEWVKWTTGSRRVNGL